MKRILPLLCRVVAAAMAVACIGCETTDGHKKKKVVTAEEFDASSGGVSGLPWNRPRAFESGSGMGRMMPQSR
jgi:hypothetical protein